MSTKEAEIELLLEAADRPEGVTLSELTPLIQGFDEERVNASLRGAMMLGVLRDTNKLRYDDRNNVWRKK